ncbi:MAG: N-acetylmuramoyl-L-alanine amidase [Dongiaceae bacterium]
MKRFFFSTIIGFMCCLFIGPLAAAEMAVQGIRIGSDSDKTRLVFDLNQKPVFKAAIAEDSNQLVIELPAGSWPKKAVRIPTQGLIDQVTYAADQKNTRVTVKLRQKADIKQTLLLPPVEVGFWRLVIDLAPAAAAPVKAAKAKQPAPAKKIIVLDPGHGGVDPGAVGLNGIFEKEVTLAAALALKEILEESGHYKVFLTRDRDRFIPLHDRVELARTKRADLFISLHADSHPNSKIGGASVYTLSDKASDKEAERLAAQENKADIIAGINLGKEPKSITNILIDLAQRETMSLSQSYAHVLVEELNNNIHVLDKPLRAAGFVVLKAPDVPSVLIELGFLSHAPDEKRLTDAAFRKKLAKSIAASIDDYFDKVVPLPRT